jgi:hypothetical protein
VAPQLRIVPFAQKHLPSVIELFADERWSYACDARLEAGTPKSDVGNKPRLANKSRPPSRLSASGEVD